MGLLAGQLPASAASGEGISGENTASAVDWTGQSGTTQEDDNSIEQ